MLAETPCLRFGTAKPIDTDKCLALENKEAEHISVYRGLCSTCGNGRGISAQVKKPAVPWWTRGAGQPWRWLGFLR